MWERRAKTRRSGVVGSNQTVLRFTAPPVRQASNPQPETVQVFPAPAPDQEASKPAMAIFGRKATAMAKLPAAFSDTV